jgi:hypothetical protein
MESKLNCYKNLEGKLVVLGDNGAASMVMTGSTTKLL